jgi:uncharacterized membrane protein
MEWLALNHFSMAHLPIAAALLAPVALLASQRVGRGIRPWWTASRFLLLAGALGAMLAVATGFAHAWQTGQLPRGGWGPAGGRAGYLALAARHQVLALLSVPLALLALRAAYARRQEHQGIGFLPLLLGCIWSAVTLSAVHFVQGGHASAAPQAAARSQAPVPPPPPPDPEAETPVRALDHQRLAPMHLEPVKSPPHGNRWIRVWVTPSAAEAYAAGKPLPAGALAVLSTLDDRWGRPGYDAGPLYMVEALAGGGYSLGYYWPKVPEARRGETGGQDRVYWRGKDPGLQACLGCHAGGLAPIQDRSQWKVPRRPKPEDTETAVAPTSEP